MRGNDTFSHRRHARHNRNAGRRRARLTMKRWLLEALGEKDAARAKSTVAASDRATDAMKAALGMGIVLDDLGWYVRPSFPQAFLHASFRRLHDREAEQQSGLSRGFMN